jgi:hypothetical protein
MTAKCARMYGSVDSFDVARIVLDGLAARKGQYWRREEDDV